MLKPISNKSSVLAVVAETEEGVISSPTSGTDYIALQEGFSFEANFEPLNNQELRASIGKAKATIGKEKPASSFHHYLRHSGIEGQAPGYGPLLEALFGAKTVNGTQYSTVASSTTKLLKVGPGVGVNFKRGQPVLVKSGTAGYQIRPVHSVAMDDLSLGFSLPTAPGAGVDLGRAVQYSPASEGHKTLSFHLYRGNGGAKEVQTGVRPVEATIDINAGQYINASFSFEGVEYAFNPVLVDTKNKLDFLDEAIERVAVVPSRLYKDVIDFTEALQTSMNSLGSANTFSVKYSNTTGKITISSTGTIFELLWNTGDSTATSVGSLIGANMAADQDGDTEYELTNAMNYASPFTPSLDVADPLVAKDNEILLGDQDDFQALRPSKVSVKIGNTRKVIDDVTARSGVAGSLFVIREVTVDITALLDKNDIEKFKRFRKGQETRFLYNGGVKSGGNWVAGKCFSLYIPTATITSFSPSDDEGLAILNFQVSAFVDQNGNGEAYLGFV